MCFIVADLATGRGVFQGYESLQLARMCKDFASFERVDTDQGFGVSPLGALPFDSARVEVNDGTLPEHSSARNCTRSGRGPVRG